MRLRGDKNIDAIVRAMERLLTSLGLKRPGLGFYGLRHSFRTIADETLDQPAANLVMGQVDGSMAAVYRERVGDARLQAVVAHIHQWLFDGDQTT